MERRDRLANAWLISKNHHRSSIDQRSCWNPDHCTAEEYIAYIREYKPFALKAAYLMADWAIEAEGIE